MAQESDDLTILSRAFEDALTNLLLEVLMEGGTSFDQQMKLRLARNRFRMASFIASTETEFMLWR